VKDFISGMFGAIKRMPYKTKNDAWRPFSLDASTWAINTLDYAHHEVHGGSSYWLNYSKALANGNTFTVALTTPAAAVSTKEGHLTLTVSSTASGTFSVYEDLTSYSGGTATTPNNRYRKYQTTNPSVMISTVRGATGDSPITLVGGTVIYSDILLSNKGVVWERRSGEEIILKPDAKYAFRVVNGVSANTVSIVLEWYEHSPRD